MGKSIQYTNADDLLKGYQNTKAPGWSLWDGRQFLTKGIGEDLLAKFLDAFEETANNCIYTLRIYEDVTDSKQIKERTEADGSFNFIFNGDPSQVTGNTYALSNNKNRLFERLGAIEQSLKELQDQEDEPEEDEKPQSIGAAVMDMINHPAKLTEFIAAINSAKALFTPTYPAMLPQPSAIGTVNPQPQSEIPDEERIQRAQAAVSTLEANDEKFVEHIEKLAQISVSNPSQFRFLISLLDKM